MHISKFFAQGSSITLLLWLQVGQSAGQRDLHRSDDINREVLLSRAASEPRAIANINRCDFPSNMQAVQPFFYRLGKFKNIGKQPNGNEKDDGRVYNAVPKWYVGEDTPDAAPYFKWYRAGTIPKDSKQSIEHVYEKQLIEVFLESQIGTADFTCKDMTSLFFPCGENKMQKIFDQLPGMQVRAAANRPQNMNIGFAGLDQDINGIKGIMFNKGFKPKSEYFKGRLRRRSEMKVIQDLIMLFGILKDQDFQKMFDETNNRVYKAFAGVDKMITNSKGANGGPLEKADGSLMPANWASTYKTWMNQYLDDISGPAWSWASTTFTDLEDKLDKDDTTEASVKQAKRKQLDGIRDHIGFTESYFKINFGLTWETGALELRDLNHNHAFTKRDGTCFFNASSPLGISSGHLASTGFADHSHNFPSTLRTVTTSGHGVPSRTIQTSSTMVSASLYTSAASTLSTSAPATTSVSLPPTTSTRIMTPTSSVIDPVTTVPPESVPTTIYIPVSTLSLTTVEPMDQMMAPVMLPTSTTEDNGLGVTPLPESVDGPCILCF